MSKTFTSPYIQNTRNLFAALVTATGTGYLQVCDASSVSAGANDSILKSFSLCSTDTVAANVGVYVDPNGTGTKYLLGVVPVPALSGTNGTAAPVDVLRSLMLPQLQYDAYLNKVLCLQAGAKLYIAAGAALSSGKQITAFAECGDL
jgi:hypothetical protein